jgi:hypothetical protein
MTGRVEVARFAALSEATVAVSFLRANEIDAELADFNLHSILPIAFGRWGVRLLVPAKQAHMASLLLAKVLNPEQGND